MEVQLNKAYEDLLEIQNAETINHQKLQSNFKLLRHSFGNNVKSTSISSKDLFNTLLNIFKTLFAKVENDENSMDSLCLLCYSIGTFCENVYVKEECGISFISQICKTILTKTTALKLLRAAAESLCNLISSSSKNQEILLNHSQECQKMFEETLFSVGDFAVQSALSEILFRITRRKGNFIDVWFHDSVLKSFLHSLRKKKDVELRIEILNFISICNEQNENTKSLWSFPFIRVEINGHDVTFNEENFVHFSYKNCSTEKHFSFFMNSNEYSKTPGEPRLIDIFYHGITEFEKPLNNTIEIMVNLKDAPCFSQKFVKILKSEGRFQNDIISILFRIKEEDLNVIDKNILPIVQTHSKKMFVEKLNDDILSPYTLTPSENGKKNRKSSIATMNQCIISEKLYTINSERKNNEAINDTIESDDSIQAFEKNKTKFELEKNITNIKNDENDENDADDVDVVNTEDDVNEVNDVNKKNEKRNDKDKHDESDKEEFVLPQSRENSTVQIDVCDRSEKNVSSYIDVQDFVDSVFRNDEDMDELISKENMKNDAEFEAGKDVKNGLKNGMKINEKNGVNSDVNSVKKSVNNIENKVENGVYSGVNNVKNDAKNNDVNNDLEFTLGEKDEFVKRKLISEFDKIEIESSPKNQMTAVKLNNQRKFESDYKNENGKKGKCEINTFSKEKEIVGNGLKSKFDKKIDTKINSKIEYGFDKEEVEMNEKCIEIDETFINDFESNDAVKSKGKTNQIKENSKRNDEKNNEKNDRKNEKEEDNEMMNGKKKYENSSDGKIQKNEFSFPVEENSEKEDEGKIKNKKKRKSHVINKNFNILSSIPSFHAQDGKEIKTYSRKKGTRTQKSKKKDEFDDNNNNNNKLNEKIQTKVRNYKKRELKEETNTITKEYSFEKIFSVNDTGDEKAAVDTFQKSNEVKIEEKVNEDNGNLLTKVNSLSEANSKENSKENSEPMNEKEMVKDQTKVTLENSISEKQVKTPSPSQEKMKKIEKENSVTNENMKSPSTCIEIPWSDKFNNAVLNDQNEKKNQTEILKFENNMQKDMKRDTKTKRREKNILNDVDVDFDHDYEKKDDEKEEKDSIETDSENPNGKFELANAKTKKKREKRREKRRNNQKLNHLQRNKQREKTPEPLLKKYKSNMFFEKKTEKSSILEKFNNCDNLESSSYEKKQVENSKVAFQKLLFDEKLFSKIKTSPKMTMDENIFEIGLNKTNNKMKGGVISKIMEENKSSGELLDSPFKNEFDFNFLSGKKRLMNDGDDYEGEEKEKKEEEILSKRRRRRRTHSFAFNSPKMDDEDDDGKKKGFMHEIGESSTVSHIVLLLSQMLEKLKRKVEVNSAKRVESIVRESTNAMEEEMKSMGSKLKQNTQELSSMFKHKFSQIEIELTDQGKQIKELFDRFVEDFNQQLQKYDQIYSKMEEQKTVITSAVAENKNSHKHWIGHMREKSKSILNDAERRLAAIEKAKKSVKALGGMLETTFAELPLC